MRSAFTISFDFKGKTYLAFAQIIEGNDAKPSCLVNVYDHTLCRIMHSDSIKYSQPESINYPKLQDPLAAKLFHCISDSISHHLESARSIKETYDTKSIS
jgi:hypothetical protein